MIQRSILFSLLLSCLLTPRSARADGGAVQLSERTGDYQIAVFTLPTPFRAGPVDISVLVQDAATGEYVPEARVTVRLKARDSETFLDYPATLEKATNKLFHAAEFELPESGWWEMSVVIDGPHGPAVVQFQIHAEPPPPRWLDLWPWFCWPALPIALFSIHRLLVRRKAPPIGLAVINVKSGRNLRTEMMPITTNTASAMS